ncbi:MULTISPECIES: FHA domain-containing protein [unclassified Leptolyngbya]|uniref:FHA domain-containing protein n=1 Tax=unclassified Leptolyngbya TaxID=2650499 RepID=UPI001682BB89|nr:MULTISPECIES: FHA domain-containing protein [unclassified Leptolyngbya]MBD1909855.1 FHA domain-containing protein [Leptolyngbya sp. FACHB-8]MBD2156951.1 FHA domain-containing protein [Leptolyngbya sp. FACHB-16]
MRIQLRWDDPTTGQRQQPFLETPIALGREFTMMPGMVDGQRVSRAVIGHPQVAEYHALITEQDGQLLITDQSGIGVQLKSGSVTVGRLADQSSFQLGPVTLHVTLPDGAASPETASLAASENPLATGAAPLSAGTDPTAEKGCDRKIGFLFQRRCGRTDPTGCSYCQGGLAGPDHDPFQVEHGYYPSYGYYGRGYWGHTYYSDRDLYSYNPYTRSIDFNESDVSSFEEEGDMDFENRLDAS